MDGWHPITRFNPAIFVCLFQARVIISRAICHGPFCVQWFEVSVDGTFVCCFMTIMVKFSFFICSS